MFAPGVDVRLAPPDADTGDFEWISGGHHHAAIDQSGLAALPLSGVDNALQRCLPAVGFEPVVRNVGNHSTILMAAQHRLEARKAGVASRRGSTAACRLDSGRGR